MITQYTRPMLGQCWANAGPKHQPLHMLQCWNIFCIKQSDQMFFFSIWNHSYLLPHHLNTYVLGPRLLSDYKYLILPVRGGGGGSTLNVRIWRPKSVLTRGFWYPEKTRDVDQIPDQCCASVLDTLIQHWLDSCLLGRYSKFMTGQSHEVG